MARRTHKMIGNNDSVRGTGNPSQANSLTAPCAKVFVPCEESLPATEVTDVINSTDFLTASLCCSPNSITLTAGQDANCVRLTRVGDTGVGGLPATWNDPAGSDWLYFGVMSAVDVGTTPENSRAVYIETYANTNGAVRVFPYRCTFRIGAIPTLDISCYDLKGEYSLSNNNEWDCDYCEGFNFEFGEVHTIAAARRGDWLEHYVDGVLVGKVNVVDELAAQGRSADVGEWENYDGAEQIELTHSGYSGGGCSSSETVGSGGADWYGVSQFVFSDGLPVKESIEEGMRWMKENWVQGNKVIYPEWVTL